MRDKRVFDKNKVDRAISECCAAFDALEMTLFERWYALNALKTAAEGILGENFAELARKYGFGNGEGAENGPVAPETPSE